MIAVTHQLEMVMDFDLVVVMEQGKVAEVRNPTRLVKDDKTRFSGRYRLVKSE